MDLAVNIYSNLCVNTKSYANEFLKNFDNRISKKKKTVILF